jgi:hypothetical protein
VQGPVAWLIQLEEDVRRRPGSSFLWSSFEATSFEEGAVGTHLVLLCSLFDQVFVLTPSKHSEAPRCAV